MVLADLITEVSSVITSIVPDFEIYVAAGVVFSMAAYVVRRFIGVGL